jgi:hypothetical protein
MKTILQPDSILQSLIDGALVATDVNVLFEEFCNNAVEGGVPLLRAQIAMRTLHPLRGGATANWRQTLGYTLRNHKNNG